MTDHELLSRLFAEHPYLIVDSQSGTVELVTTGRAFDATRGGGSKVVVHIERALRNFAALVRDRDEFTVRDLTKIAARNQQVIDKWMRRRIIQPSIERGARGRFSGGIRRLHRFAFKDAFLAGLCGSLGRQGVRSEMLTKVSELFYLLRPSDVASEAAESEAVR